MKKAAVLLFTSLLITSIPSATFAADSPPTLTGVYQKGDHAKIEWSTPMADIDILTQTGFESGQEIPNINWNGPGKQSFEQVAGQGTVLQINDTMTNMEGNVTDQFTPKSINSLTSFIGKSIPSNSTISFTFKARAYNGSTANMAFVMDTGWHKHGYPLIHNGKTVVYNALVDWYNPPMYIPVKNSDGSRVDIADGGIVVLVSNKRSNYDFGVRHFRFDQANQRFVNTEPGQPVWATPTPLLPWNPIINEVFKPGDTMLYLGQSNYAIPDRSIPQDGQWHTISSNTFIPDISADHDTLNNGMWPRLSWYSNGIIQLDDIKIGYASESEIFRDGQSVYKGYLSDYEDVNAIDKTAPNAPTNIIISVDGNKKPVVSWSPATDNGTTYNYQVKGYPKNGTPTVLSNNTPVTITSGIKGYSIVIDQSPNTNPGTSIVTTSTNYVDNNIVPAGQFYVHIATIDNQGNVSSISHVPYNYNTQPVLTVDQNNLKTNDTNNIKLTGTIQDVDNDSVTINVVVAGITKQVTISNTATPQNWILEWAGTELPEGIYTNIVVTASDGK